jgi:hypothetical protein
MYDKYAVLVQNGLIREDTNKHSNKETFLRTQ